ncbi:MAG TPA: hypothetical protein VK921_01720 [Anditalea sp.]|nr:hypothetical protein [Anditalea sp.]
MKLISLWIGLMIIISAPLHAQSYGTSAGLRLGSNKHHRTLGLSLQQRVLKDITLEGIIQSDFSNNHTAHLLVEKHSRIISKRFNYYYGAGMSIGSEESLVKNPETREITRTYGNGTLNADLIIGVEMTMLRTNFSLDYKPSVNLIGNRGPWYAGQVGISARHVIVKSAEQKRNLRKKKRNKRRGKTPFFENIRNKIRGY